ncbi:ABC transporter substrate-binding protein [Aquabacterium sp.]|uniref:ABC transporter substrate-binding protein n=1 Tax=Aquabacterium sp. TaxID=1872578 RepID=UPI002C33C5D3|nr:ABC transporter substrate-binding protein [Aquabacterium sp.]HSW07941.1 ABC transporter substrate-binding protein [Aquabacterium sp.]
MHHPLLRATLLACGVLFATAIRAEIVIGVSFSQTGPAAALGIAPRNAMQLFPDQIGGEKLRFVVLDDATDSTSATKNARRFVSEDKVDLIIGSTASPPALAIAEVAREAETVQLAAAPIELPEGRDGFTFRLPQGIALMAEGTVAHMKKTGVRSFGFLGYTDAYGESWQRYMSRYADAAGIKLSASERFSRTDASVTAQALKVVASNPDAVLVVASGSGAVMPQKALLERGFKGRIYQTYSAVAPDLLRMGGKDVEDTLGLSGPAVAADQLPDGHPSKPVALDFIRQYEAKFGAGSYNQFAANIWGAKLLLDKAIPLALKSAKPGTREFRLALKQALETMGEVVVPQGVLRYSATDHFGYDERARFVLSAQGGSWRAAR